MDLRLMKLKPTRKKVKTMFSENLAMIVKERGITQKTLAEIAGVNRSVINSWLSGVVPQDLNAVLKISKSLKLDFQYLLTGEHSNFSPKDLQISEIFDVEIDPDFSGIFMLEAKRLRKK